MGAQVVVREDVPQVRDGRLGRSEIRDFPKWKAPAEAIAADLRAMFATDAHLIEVGVIHHRQGKGCAKAALRIEWLHVELRNWGMQGGQAPRKISKGAKLEDVPRNESLPAVRRYYQMPRKLFGLWVFETRQLLYAEREYATRKALRQLEREGYGRLGTERGHAIFELCYPPAHGQEAPQGEPGEAHRASGLSGPFEGGILADDLDRGSFDWDEA